METFRRIARAINDSGLNQGLRFRLVDSLIRVNNLLAGSPAARPTDVGEPVELAEIRGKARQRTVVNDHLETIFLETVAARPALIVELGVENGFTTFVFERAARLTGARLVSVDYNDCSGVTDWKDWIFVLSDDLEFARRFPDWSREKGLPSAVDVLFIDTDHRYEPTVREINAWFPLLGPRAKVIFHDSNVKSVYYRTDGSLGRARDFKRGVIQAVEEHLGCRLDEQRDFTTLVNGWLVRHHANCNGLTILERLGLGE